MPGEDLLQHGVAVHDQAKRLAHVVVVEWRHVDRHAERAPVGTLAFQDGEAALTGDDSDLRCGDIGHGVDLSAAQRVYLRGHVREVDDRDRVEVGQAAAPVTPVALVHALLALGEALDFVRTRPNLLTGARVPDRDDAVVVLAELVANR